MTDHDSERVLARAAAALRRPQPGDDAARERLVQQMSAAFAAPRQERGSRLSWWAGVAAAAVAFAVGLGAGRASTRPTLVTSVAAAVSPDAPERSIAFVFVAPSARHVSIVGDFNGWDAAATPLQRADGRSTWSVAVRLPPGRHVYAFVVDGATWVADPQAPLAPEQWFGQRNSVIVVSEDRRS